jgi:anti-anti-sigma factor
MAAKNRLGSDPLGFIQDTKGGEDDAQKETPKELGNAGATHDKKKKGKGAKADSKVSIELKKVSGKKGSLGLSGEVTLYSSEEIFDKLKKGMKKYKDLSIDLSGVNKMDTSGYQLILLAITEAEKRSQKVSLTGPSQEVKEIFSLYGNERYI